MRIALNTSNPADYRRFLAVKRLPQYRIAGGFAWFPDEYADRVGAVDEAHPPADYAPHPQMLDYQQGIARLAVEKERFAVFADCGLGKTFILLDFARNAADHLPAGRRVLIVAPLMVIGQTIAEAAKFYGDSLPIRRVSAADLQDWLNGEGEDGIGITNYDAIHDDLTPGVLGSMILDESSMLKSHYGKWGTTLIRLGRGLRWKLACTGTPAPNDRIEYANHAVFLDAFPNTNSFLARFFVNRGQTDNRWELKPHALRPFYRALSHWSIFVTDPSVYGWKDGPRDLPPIHTHHHNVPLTPEQVALAFEQGGDLFAINAGGITSRSVLSQIAKGHHKGQDVPTNKPAYIRELVESWPDESTIIWCLYNAEQDRIAREFPQAANITGQTPVGERERLIDDFKARRRRVLISKPAILGFGLNLQVATRQVFSGLQDSYEQYYQAVKRSNRYGSTRPLNVHIPITEIERPMVETVLRKAARVEADAREQEKEFRRAFAD